ncbi:MAG: ferritin-like domain-containing protein, partial [Actinomycetota bacterium]|nr:ferritin-like domain-containing protein [Actinomycetota bacterium]
MTDQIANPALAEVQVEDMSRSSFIAKGAIAVGAVYGMTMVGPYVRKALAQGGMGDIDILNFALTLEYLEAAFYEQGKATPGLK